MFGLCTKKQKEEELQSLREELEAKIAEKESEIQSKSNELENATKNLAEKESEIQNKIVELENVTKNLSEKSGAFDELEKKHEQLLNNPELLEKIVADSKVAEISEKLNKAKKELDDAEDEIEDLEDDLKDEKKKHQQKKEQFDELQNRFSELEKTSKETSEKLEKSEKKADELGKDLTLKSGSLNFVREILKAKSLSENGEMKERYDAIYEIAAFIRGEFQDCNKEFYEQDDYCDYIFGWGLYHWIAISQKEWLKNKTTIAFVGEFSAGKTSIVNKILSHGGTNLSLPVSTKATTAIPTYISGSSSSSISYYFFTPDNELKTISEKTFKSIDKSVLGEIDGISNLIKYFIMSCNNPNLQSMSILDTPGFSSNDKEDADRTAEVINECDALFWVFDVNAGTVNRSSLKIIKEKLEKPLFVVINKVDTKSPSEVDSVEKLLRQTFDKEKIKVEKFLRFSDRQDPSVLLDTLKAIPRTNESSYLDDLKDFANGRLKFLKDKFADAKSGKDTAESEVDDATNDLNEKTDEISNGIETINRTAIAAHKLVASNYKEHIFASNKYELESYQADDFFDKMSEIASESENLNNNKINEHIACVQSWRDKSIDYFNFIIDTNKLEYQSTRYEECVKKLKKLLKKFM